MLRHDAALKTTAIACHRTALLLAASLALVLLFDSRQAVTGA